MVRLIDHHSRKMKNDAPQNKGRFGSFGGVFTPNILTILGIILFLRTGWVVGQAGLAGALIIIVIANLISLFTGLSLASVATNMHVRTGGTYFMISRTLGFEIGGAIGVPLYLSQAISVAFYVIGFAEALTLVFPRFDPAFISLGLVLGFGFMAYVGADVVIKIQYVILIVLALAMVSLFSGGGENWVSPEYFASAESSESFWSVFAVFFPAVTGIMVGVSMSGDLKEPGRAIPRGTLSAIVVSFIIYAGAAVWLGTHAGRAELVSDNLIMQKIARWPIFILLGVWLATLSSALGSAIAAPRTLQALALDRVVPMRLSAQLGSGTEPRLAVIITTAIAVAVVLMGNLDFVAPIIAMFFLNTYGMINVTAGVERLVDNPSFRPQFKVPWPVSFVGGLGCYGAMFLIHPPSTVLALVVSYGIYFILKRRRLRQNWGDLRSGLWFSLIRFGLIRLEASPWHVRNWRPNILAFTGTAGTSHSREQLMEMASWFSAGGGIVTLYHLLVGDIDELAGRGLCQASLDSLKKYIGENRLDAFAGCSVVGDLYEGIVTALQAHGISGLEPNTALIGFSRKPEVRREQFRLMRKTVALGKSVLYLHYNQERGYGPKKRIDIWWRGRDRNADMMLILAHILTQSGSWEGAGVRILRLVDKEEARSGAEAHMQRLLDSLRVKAEPVVLVKDQPEQTFRSVFRSASRETDLVVLGVAVPEPENFESAIGFLEDLLQSSPSVLFVRSAETEPILE